ncbi:MAG: alpha/beta fold hydrolase [Myxococcota bacterium]
MAMALAQRPRYIPRVRNHSRVVDGVRVHWAEVGPQDGRPVVLLHGVSDSHRTWLRMAPHLASGRRLLMPDLAGHGYSSRPDASYSLDWHARVIGRWLESERLPSVDVIGHSYGGGVAQWMLLGFRAHVRRVALVAAGGLGKEVGLPLRLSTLPMVVERLGQPFMGAGTVVALRMLLAGKGDPEDIAHRSKMNAIPGTARALARTMRDVVGLGGQSRHFLDRAHEIADLPPIGLFWGESDPVIPCTHGRATATLLGGAPLVTFPGVGHFPQVERPIELAHTLRDFFDAHELPSARLVHARAAQRAAAARTPAARGDQRDGTR